jgi:outer membrane protein assembly factor BamB
MDYSNKKGVKWYWWTLLTIYAGGVIYWVLWSDPYLYSHVEFQKALVGKKSEAPQVLRAQHEEAPSAAPFQQEVASLALWNHERTGVDYAEVTRNRKFIEESSTDLTLPEGYEPQQYVTDSQGVVMVNAKGVVLSFDWDGQLQWKFTPPENLSFFRPLLLNSKVILSSRKGHLYALNRGTGDLDWYTPLAQEIFSDPILTDKTILLPIRPWTRDLKSENKAASKDEAKEDLSPGLAEVDLNDGTWLRISPPLPLEKEVHWSLRGKDLYLAHDKSVFDIDLASLEVKKKKDFEAEVVSPPMLLVEKMIVSTRDGRIFGVNYKNFEVDFESDLGHSLSVPPWLLPIFDRLAIVTDNGYLHVIEAKEGERKWRYNLQNESPSRLGWSSRLNGKHIEQLNLGWTYKGWSLWVPCVKDRVCIYNPMEGQIIDRILLSGAYTGTPYVKDKDFYFLLKKDKGWKIARYGEKALSEKSPES